MTDVLVIGSSNTDLVCRSPRIPAPGETITGRSFATFPGGKGANQAVAAARAGASVEFVGARGDDAFGIARRGDLIAEGIGVDRMRVIEHEASGVALIVVDDRGENQIVYVPGANNHISLADAESALSSIPFKVLSLTHEIPFDTVVHALRSDRKGALAVLNAAPFDPRIREILGAVDVLICNEGEASAIVGYPVSDDRIDAAAAEILELGTKAVVLTLGPAGAVAANETGVWHTPAPSVQPVDTTGAGDAFCGAFCAWLSAGESLAKAVEAGVAAGALAVTREGAQPSIPNRDAIVGKISRMNNG